MDLSLTPYLNNSHLENIAQVMQQDWLSSAFHSWVSTWQDMQYISTKLTNIYHLHLVPIKNNNTWQEPRKAT